jgi:hypothetical protein
VGCGCRGRALGGAVARDGHAVRGTTRDPSTCVDIEAAGIESYVGDPDRVGTLTAALDAVTIVCWLMGTAQGDPDRVAALHGSRWEAFLSKIVDTTVRGVVYEAAGTVGPAPYEHGREIAAIAGRTWEIPLAVVDADPAGHDGWLSSMTGAVDGLLAG